MKKMKVNYIRKCDAVSGMLSLPDASIDMVVTSPPYDQMRTNGNAAVFDFPPIAREIWRVIKPGGVVCWVVEEQISNWSESGTSSVQRLYFKELGFALYNTLIMQPNFQRTNTRVRYGRSPQYCFVLSKGKPKTIDLIRDRKNSTAGCRTPSTFRNENGSLRFSTVGVVAEYGVRQTTWHYMTGGSHLTADEFAMPHGSMMPEWMARDLVRSWSSPGDLILDPMCGAATTTKMAAMEHRHWIGFEPFEKHYQISLQRMKSLWDCPCGAINHGTDFACGKCGATKLEQSA